MTFHPGGLATGIGSLPYTEAGQALPIIFETMPSIPHWPQLPLRGSSEGFVFQFLNPLVQLGLLVFEGERVFFDVDSPQWPDRLTEFYTAYLACEAGDQEALQMFAFPENAATGFFAFINKVKEEGVGEAQYLKGHMVGPLTAGFQVKDSRGNLAYYEEQLHDVLVKTLALHARWQAQTLAALGRPAIIFVDEPAIGAYGTSSHITITREMIINDLNAIFEQIHAAGALAGVHSCDAVDWSLLYESDLEIVNLDAYNFGESLIPYAKETKSFLERGGIMAWGIVPTMEKVLEEDADSLLTRLYSLWGELEKRGADRGLLRKQALITPACGTGLLDQELAERIYGLTEAVSEKFRVK